MKPIIDSHLDISWNALSYNRDQTETIEVINAREVGMADHKARSHATLSLPELRESGAGVILATILVRAKREVQPSKGHMRWDLDFGNQTICSATALGQLSYYRLLEKQNEMTSIKTVADLNAQWKSWEAGDWTQKPVGYILAMEGADPIIEPADAEFWWNEGLRSITLSHYGKSHYSVGTGDDGPLTDKGHAILKEFNRLGMILDLTHMSDTSFYEALKVFTGPVMASHNNCRALVPGDRQFSDEQIKLLIERGGVIGSVLDAWMLHPGYVRLQTPNENIKLASLIDHMDHICQLAGNTDHVALGTDLDGGFGTEQCPGDFKRYRDLQKLAPLLLERGYNEEDVNKIFYSNWLNFFRKWLPKE
jgi:membrane dipeptidase